MRTGGVEEERKKEGKDLGRELGSTGDGIWTALAIS